MDIDKASGLLIQVAGETTADDYRLAAEIYNNGEFIARVTQRNDGHFKLVIFSGPDQEDIVLDVDAFVSTLERSKSIVAE
jgi:hypothetical protein